LVSNHQKAILATAGLGVRPRLDNSLHLDGNCTLPRLEKQCTRPAQTHCSNTLDVQLVFNFFWSFIFFRQHQLDWALGEIIVLWLFILLTIFAFARISKVAAWLLVPYISWVSFASILTYTIYQLNQ